MICVSVGLVKNLLSGILQSNLCLATILNMTYFGFSDDCLLLHESSAENSMISLRYFHSAISNHPSIAISRSPEWMVA